MTDSLPNSGEPRDRLSASSGEAQLRKPLPLGSGKVTAWQQKPLDPNIQEIIKRHRTAAGAFRELFEPIYQRVPAFLHGPTPEADCARFERIFRPWPKWVLRISSELWHVYYPTIDREVFFQTFRSFNACFFRCPLNPERQMLPKTAPMVDRTDMHVLSLVLASILGHAVEHFESYRRELDEQLSAGIISQERYEELSKVLSTELFENSLRQNFEAWSKDKSVKPQDLTRVFEEARRKTFDKHGRRKESPLVPIYREIFNNWVKIEGMSGPKELTDFLSPHLGNQEFEDKYERVKAICKRTRIKFRPRQGTAKHIVAVP